MNMDASKTDKPEKRPPRTIPVFGPLSLSNFLIWFLLIAAVFAFRWIVFEPFKIPSGSMETTLDGDPRIFRGDRVAVNKHSYGIRVPFMNKYIWEFKDPERWDIVVFRAVDPESPNKILIKRIVGLPGETVHIAGGKIHVNGESLELPEGMPDVYYTIGVTSPGNTNDLERLREDFSEAIYERNLRQLFTSGNAASITYGNPETPELCVVPEGHYFVCGDNSAHSQDGRFFGWLPREHLLGRTFCIWWPLNHWRDFTGFSSTWWGWLFLYGIPAFFVAWELRGFHRHRRARGKAS